MSKLERARHVRVGIEEADTGQRTRYRGRAGLARLAAEVKAEGRRLAAQRKAGRRLLPLAGTAPKMKDVRRLRVDNGDQKRK